MMSRELLPLLTRRRDTAEPFAVCAAQEGPSAIKAFQPTANHCHAGHVFNTKLFCAYVSLSSYFRLCPS